MPEQNEVDVFLVEIQKLSNKHKREKTFNALTTFGVNDKETMHTRFLAMLLNPKGEHNFGDRFLELFLKQPDIDEQICIKSEFKDINVKCEKTADGRYIDIALWNKIQFIVIENKFWAGDQDNQLRDYYNFALKHSKSEVENVLMLYLTPYGRKPTENSYLVGVLPDYLKALPKEKVICISYQKHILDWLEACINSFNSSDNIRLKISLEMYVELIRNVINRDKYMEEIMSKLLSNPENMKLAIDIVKVFQGREFLKDRDSRKIIINRIEKIAKEHFELDFPDGDDETELWYLLCLKKNATIKGYLCFTDTHIYGKDINEVLHFKYQIAGNDINDINLYNILINDTKEIDKWLVDIVNDLTNNGEAENQAE